MPICGNATGTLNLLNLVYDFNSQCEAVESFTNYFKDKAVKEICFETLLHACSFLFSMYA